jgi:mannose-6-phosphate isomerase-like protein (cupin superfamily)/DNA-binding XRE family transcriptional regulator
MEPKGEDIVERVRSLRETEGFSQRDMADAVGIPLDEYAGIESGKKELTFTFVYRCAGKLGVDMAELLTGETPKLTGYTVARGGRGIPMERREGFRYSLLASSFKHKTVEPFIVFAPYDADALDRPIPLSAHEGQEFDYVLEGKMEFRYGKHLETLGPGDSVFYDSGKGHGMIAMNKEGCRFIAVVVKKDAVG